MSGSVLHNLLVSLICGFTEFLGVDATAHCGVLELMTGSRQYDPVLLVALRVGALLALLVSSWPRLRRLMREQSYAGRSRRLKRPPDPIAQLDLKLLRFSLIFIIGGVFLYSKTSGITYGFLGMSLVMLLNAMILFIPRVINSGNKDGRAASRLDGMVLGFGGILGFVPGFSRMGCMIAAGSMTGLDRGYCLDMSLLLSIPAFLGMLILDTMAIVAAKVTISLVTIALCGVYALVAFFTGWAAIVLMRFLSIKIGYTGFAYYSLGLSLFTSIFYLVI